MSEDPFAPIVAEARADVAAGRAPDAAALEARIREAARSSNGAGAQRALKQLAHVLAVHRARQLVARETPTAPPPAPAPRRAVLRARPTINANMDVRRERDGERFVLRWDAAPAVVGWEVRISERPDPRGDYSVREALSLPAGSTELELQLGDHPLRVHVLGRSRDGRLLRRAVMSALTRETWSDRWQRRASAA